MALGSRLRRTREAAGLTREVLAVSAGVSVSTLLRLENDATARPRIDVLEKIAAQLGTTTSALLAPEDPAAVAS